jgi:membrane protease YdiL (CAAX protease family)
MENRPTAQDRPELPWGPTAAFLVVAADFALITLLPRVLVPLGWVGEETRAPIFLFRALLVGSAAGFLLFSRRAKPETLGLCLGAPRAGLRASALCAGGVAVLLAAGAGLAVFLKSRGTDLLGPSRPVDFALLPGLLAWNLVAFPILEEVLYRGILLPPLEREVGRAGAIAISGLVFQALHLAYGIPLPHYFLGGMILAWVFLRGRSLVFPIALHALWNLFIVGFEVSRSAGWVPF